MSKTILLETHNIKNLASGFGTFNYGLINGLSNLDHDNLNITLLTQQPHKLSNEFGNKFKYKKIYGFNRYASFRIRKKHDLWHSVNQNLKFEPYAVTKYLLTIHDVNFAEAIATGDSNNKRARMFNEKLERCDAITYISSYAKVQAHSYFKIPDVPEYIIYNGNPIIKFADTSSFIPNIPVNKPYLYSIGDFLHKKNFISIINMMQYVPDFNLVISGDNNKSYGEEVKKAINEAGLEKNIFLTGRVTDAGKQYYMKNCAAFVFPSVGEGFGLPPIEAMKFGVPVFLANRTSLPEIGGEYAFYWDDFDPECMAQVLQNGFNTYSLNPELYNQKYLERANSFNWDTAAKQYIDVYRSIVNK